jgi:hypothetical protein
MATRWIMAAAALLSVAGLIGVGNAAQGNVASMDAPVSGTASEDAVLTEAPSTSYECYVDGCRRPHQACRCHNTGWAGYCGTGPHHPGCLYCRCN